MDCLFCKIVAGTIPAKKVYEDDHAVAFHDINPQAPVHMLIIPKRHIAALSELKGHDDEKFLVGHLHAVASDLARQHKLDKGYRTVINTGEARRADGVSHPRAFARRPRTRLAAGLVFQPRSIQTPA